MDTSLLPHTFSLRDARKRGVRKDQVYRLLTQGDISRIGRGIYQTHHVRRPELEDLVAASRRQSLATLCLDSALVYHGLSDSIPSNSDIALPRGTHHPRGFPHVTWRSFDGDTFLVGREEVNVARDVEVGIYSAPRTIIDALRLAHQEGSSQGYRALRLWLSQPGNSYAELLSVADHFPKALPRLRRALEVLG